MLSSAMDKEERQAKSEGKMLLVNRRVYDFTATPAEEAAWRRWNRPRLRSIPRRSSVKRMKKAKDEEVAALVVDHGSTGGAVLLRSCRP